jgi:L-amino acid N-acyltransferase YncA
MKSDVTIRASNASDVAAITAIYAHHVLHGTGTFEIDPPDEAEIAKRWSGLVDRGFPWLVAVVDNSVIGYAYAGPFREREAYRFTLEDSIYIHPEWMGKGVGIALLRELIAVCKRDGFKQILAVIGDSENLGSIRVHERCGFMHCGAFKKVGLKFDRWLDVVMMQLEI